MARGAPGWFRATANEIDQAECFTIEAALAQRGLLRHDASFAFASCGHASKHSLRVVRSLRVKVGIALPAKGLDYLGATRRYPRDRARAIGPSVEGAQLASWQSHQRNGLHSIERTPPPTA